MSNPRVVFDQISSAIGSPSSKDAAPIDTEDGESTSLSVSTYDPKAVPVAAALEKAKPIEEQDLLDDFTFARKSQQMIIESAGQALQEAISAAIASGNPEGFSAVASLMAQLTAGNKSLIEIHRAAARASKERPNPEKKNEEPTVVEQKSGDNIFMTGTTEDMIEVLRKMGKIKSDVIQGN
jgi:hypothetical protein